MVKRQRSMSFCAHMYMRRADSTRLTTTCPLYSTRQQPQGYLILSDCDSEPRQNGLKQCNVLRHKWRTRSDSPFNPPSTYYTQRNRSIDNPIKAALFEYNRFSSNPNQFSFILHFLSDAHFLSSSTTVWIIFQTIQWIDNG
jgi:hypothetical protein